jgi:hypothetical protein
MVTYPESWVKRLQPFADAVGKTVEEITDCLKYEVGDPGEQALEALASEEFTPLDALKVALKHLEIPPAILRKNVGLLRVKKAAAPVDGAGSLVKMTGVLPAIPDDTSFVEALKVGGDLRVGVTEVIAAVKACLAYRVGFYDLPDMLKNSMEKFAESLDEPCSPEFFEVQDLVVKRSYADVLRVFKVSGSFVTEGRKKTFLSKLEGNLWASLGEFQRQLAAWNKSWNDNNSNPMAIAAAFASAVGGGGAVPAGMMTPPDTATLRDAAEAAIMTINKVFAGFGIPIARAMAYEAEQIKSVLENAKLPSLLGAANREQMLKLLGVDVAGDFVRLERNLVQYTVAVMEYPKITAGQQELMYLTQLLQLGVVIDFDRLVTKSTPFSGKKTADGHRQY